MVESRRAHAVGIPHRSVKIALWRAGEVDTPGPVARAGGYRAAAARGVGGPVRRHQGGAGFRVRPGRGVLRGAAVRLCLGGYGTMVTCYPISVQLS